MQNTIENMKLTPHITDLRGTRLGAIHPGSVLLPKQEDLCCTSHYSSSRETSALRVITLREESLRVMTLREKNSLLYELLLFKQGNLCSTSHYSSSKKDTSTLRVITLREANSLRYG